MTLDQKIAVIGRRHYLEEVAIIGFRSPEEWTDACKQVIRAFCDHLIEELDIRGTDEYIARQIIQDAPKELK